MVIETIGVMEGEMSMGGKALESDGYTVYGCEPNSHSSTISGISLLPVDALLDTCDYLVIALAHDEFKNDDVKKRIMEKPYYDCIGFLRG